MEENNRNYEGAEELLARACKADPTHVSALCEHARILAMRFGKYEEALVCIGIYMYVCTHTGM